MSPKEVPDRGYRFGEVTGKPQAYGTLEMMFLYATIPEDLQCCVSPSPPNNVYEVRAVGKTGGSIFNMNEVYSAKELQIIQELDLTEVLIGLSQSEYSGVKIAVISHPQTPLEVLEILSRDTNQDVRLAAQKRLKVLKRN